MVCNTTIHSYSFWPAKLLQGSHYYLTRTAPMLAYDIKRAKLLKKCQLWWYNCKNSIQSIGFGFIERYFQKGKLIFFVFKLKGSYYRMKKFFYFNPLIHSYTHRNHFIFSPICIISLFTIPKNRCHIFGDLSKL